MLKKLYSKVYDKCFMLEYRKHNIQFKVSTYKVHFIFLYKCVTYFHKFRLIDALKQVHIQQQIDLSFFFFFSCCIHIYSATTMLENSKDPSQKYRWNLHECRLGKGSLCCGCSANVASWVEAWVSLSGSCSCVSIKPCTIGVIRNWYM